MKLYLSISILRALIIEPKRREIVYQMEQFLQGHERFYTSVYSMLMLFSSLPTAFAKKHRMILHLVDEVVEEILPLERQVLELFVDPVGKQGEWEIETSIAVLSGLDTLLIYSESVLTSRTRLPIRNLFGKTD